MSASVLLALLALAPRARATAAAGLDRVALARAVEAIAREARPARLGVGVRVLDTGESWYLAGEQPFPMQSVFKAPLAAAILDRRDAGALALDSALTLTRADLGPPYSPINVAFPGRTRYTIGELLERAVTASDNTAADVLLRLLGGPRRLTQWLQAHGIAGIRVDRYERELQTESVGLGRFRPEWTRERALAHAVLAVPAARRRQAMAAYLAGPRDSMTPRGAVTFLELLARGRLLSRPSTAGLLGTMARTQTGPRRLKAGLPAGSRLAHKTGTGRTDLGVNQATNDIGLVTLPDGRRVAIAVLLSGSRAPEARREATLAAVARAVVDHLGAPAAR